MTEPVRNVARIEKIKRWDQGPWGLPKLSGRVKGYTNIQPPPHLHNHEGTCGARRQTQQCWPQADQWRDATAALVPAGQLSILRWLPTPVLFCHECFCTQHSSRQTFNNDTVYKHHDLTWSITMGCISPIFSFQACANKLLSLNSFQATVCLREVYKNQNDVIQHSQWVGGRWGGL